MHKSLENIFQIFSKRKLMIFNGKKILEIVFISIDDCSSWESVYPNDFFYSGKILTKNISVVDFVCMTNT
jgi:hypothetical protein